MHPFQMLNTASLPAPGWPVRKPGARPVCAPPTGPLWAANTPSQESLSRLQLPQPDAPPASQHQSATSQGKWSGLDTRRLAPHLFSAPEASSTLEQVNACPPSGLLSGGHCVRVSLRTDTLSQSTSHTCVHRRPRAHLGNN